MVEHRGGHGGASSASCDSDEPSTPLHHQRTNDTDTTIQQAKFTDSYWWHFDHVTVAQGYNLLGTGRGPIVMSNIFLSTAFIYLASEQVGCLQQQQDADVTDDVTINAQWVVVEDCDQKVYGAFRPASLVSNIAVVSGVLSALFMPVIGALIDYTPHRRTVGVVSALLILAIQVAQIATTSSTWMIMAILQALVGFIYQVQVLATYAYLPDIARTVGEDRMTKYTASFYMVQFASQTLFLIIMMVLSQSLGLSDVATARASQAINATTITISFYFGWSLLPSVPAKHKLPPGGSMLLQGFWQNWNTIRVIHRDYRKGLQWYLLGVVFGEAAANAFTVVAVVFLAQQLGMSGSQIGIFFFVTILAMIPGGKLSSFVTSRSNPNVSWRLSMLSLFVAAVVGALGINKDNVYPAAYLWGTCLGLLLGWFYPAENLFFSLCVPHGQEAELAGFFIYCTQIIGWFPPLIFSFMVEANIEQGIGVICIAGFFLLAIGVLSMAAPWNEIVEEVHNHEGKSKLLGEHPKQEGVMMVALNDQ